MIQFTAREAMSPPPAAGHMSDDHAGGRAGMTDRRPTAAPVGVTDTTETDE
ncbi:hypothetical protein AB0E83_01360 [Streptomyces sp. NPDC035033]|uniref:hypothetical protein n=1 Tax=Streptomyces sp. NPDC035033 TaxID=3155368 RepID=UPI0033C7135A